MKKVITIFLLLFSLKGFTQPYYLDSMIVNFETIDPGSVYIDTTQSNNLWAIDAPGKIFFNSAYSLPNAIFTDSSGNYPVNNTSSFYIRYSDSTVCATELRFKYMIDSDKGMDGGKIEVSVDSGTTWYNVFDAPAFMTEGGMTSSNIIYDTLYNGEYGITGGSGSWNEASIWLQWFIPRWNWPIATGQILFRFSFLSDGIDNPHEGWMLDDIKIYYPDPLYHCTGSVGEMEEDKIKLFPNPAVGILRVEGLKTKMNYSIYNMLGEKLLADEISETNHFLIQTGSLLSGMYWIMLTDKEGKTYSKQFIKQ